ncbi:unnamed protein product [Arabis nemorensis]|uniref:Uncharacterized protein n=1 Tax=Arabis nemorensis TaxID=586526 RepID=A0A565C2Y2_9BRAS|nr:unnamed protein product [Arabis nemorensis]
MNLSLNPRPRSLTTGEAMISIQTSKTTARSFSTEHLKPDRYETTSKKPSTPIKTANVEERIIQAKLGLHMRGRKELEAITSQTNREYATD